MEGQHPTAEGLSDDLLGLVSSMESAPLADPTEMTPEQLQSEMIRSQLDSSAALVAIAETMTEDTDKGETVLEVLQGIRDSLRDLVKVAREALGQNPSGG